jgi:hypothetical protein
MPKSETHQSTAKVNDKSEQKARAKPSVEALSQSPLEDGVSSRWQPLPGGDFGQAAFERHAALLGDPRLARPMYAQRRATLVRQLQRDYGNHYVRRLVDHVSRKCAVSIQTKLTVGRAGDSYEREADQIAKRVTSSLKSSPGPGFQTKGDDGFTEDLREGTVGRITRRMPGKSASIGKPTAQRKEGFEDPIGLEGGEVGADVERAIQDAKPGGRPLPDKVRAPMERAFGTDFSGVRVHTGPQAETLNRSMSARAFTAGQDIFFSQGEYRPESARGAEILAHELTHVVQQNGGAIGREPTDEDEQAGSEPDVQASPLAEDAAIQRRIGFEVETGIPITERVDTSGTITYENIDVPDIADKVKVTKGKLSADHVKGHKKTASEPFKDWPIVELVTDPVADDMKLSDFETVARAWINELIRVKQLAQTSPPAKQLKDSYYVGLPSAQPYSQWDRIAPQATVGVPLDQVGKIISAFDISGTSSQGYATEYAQKAPGVAGKVMQDLLDKYPPGTDGVGVQALKGLLVLMCNYLAVGGDNRIAKVIYMKNRPANVFYKTKLSVVRQNIVANPFPASVLGDDKGRQYLKGLLLTATGRADSQRLFVGGGPSQGAPSDVTVGDWIDEVLSGTDDQIFDEMKNEWSQEIDPDAANEVVIELRRLGSFTRHDNYALEDDAGLLAFLKKVYGANQLFKQRKV